MLFKFLALTRVSASCEVRSWRPSVVTFMLPLDDGRRVKVRLRVVGIVHGTNQDVRRISEDYCRGVQGLCGEGELFCERGVGERFIGNTRSFASVDLDGSLTLPTIELKHGFLFSNAFHVGLNQTLLFSSSSWNEISLNPTFLQLSESLASHFIKAIKSSVGDRPAVSITLLCGLIHQEHVIDYIRNHYRVISPCCVVL